MHGNYGISLLRYGVIAGLILCFAVLIRKWLILPLNQPVSYVENFTLLLIMFICLWHYRSGLDKKQITFKEGYIVCLGLGVVASVIYGMFIYLYALRIDTEIITRSFEMQRNLEQNKILTDEQIRAMVKPQSLAMSAILLSAVLSLLWAMIVALILRTEKAEVRIKTK